MGEGDVERLLRAVGALAAALRDQGCLLQGGLPPGVGAGPLVVLPAALTEVLDVPAVIVLRVQSLQAQHLIHQGRGVRFHA